MRIFKDNPILMIVHHKRMSSRMDGIRQGLSKEGSLLHLWRVQTIPQRILGIKMQGAKSHLNFKRRSKLSLFTDDMISYVRNAKDYTPKKS